MTGFWVNAYTYQMHDARTARTRQVVVFARDGGASEVEEVADIVAEYKERFAEELEATPAHQLMPRSQQHELAPHLRAIEKTHKRVRETGHGKYW